MTAAEREAVYQLNELIHFRGMLAEAAGALVVLNTATKLPSVERIIAEIRVSQKRSLFPPANGELK